MGSTPALSAVAPQRSRGSASLKIRSRQVSLAPKNQQFADDEGRKGLDTLHAIPHGANKTIPNFHISFLGLGWKQEVQSLRASQGISANYVGFIPEF